MEFLMPNDNPGLSQNQPTEQSPKYVTLDEIGNIVNAAVTSHLKRSLNGAIDAAIKPILDKLNAMTAQQPAPAEGEGEGGGKKGKQNPETLALAKRLEDMEKALQAERDRAAAAEKKAREERAYSELRSSLEGKIRPEFLDIVAKHLFIVENRVEFDDNGTPLFKSTRVPYTGADPEEVRLPLKVGVEEYLKSDAAKAFLPAPVGSSAGPLPKRPQQTPGSIDFTKPALTDADKTRRAAERERMARERLGQME